MRWSAPGVVRGRRRGTAARRRTSRTTWRPRRRARAADPAFLAADDAERAVDAAIAALAATVALRRHARGAATGERAGRDLRDVRLLVGSGGVLRHAPAGVAAVLAAVADRPRRRVGAAPAAAAVVDVDYVLAAGGLLAADIRAAAAGAAALARHGSRRTGHRDAPTRHAVSQHTTGRRWVDSGRGSSTYRL